MAGAGRPSFWLEPRPGKHLCALERPGHSRPLVKHRPSQLFVCSFAHSANTSAASQTPPGRGPGPAGWTARRLALTPPAWPLAPAPTRPPPRVQPVPPPIATLSQRPLGVWRGRGADCCGQRVLAPWTVGWRGGGGADLGDGTSFRTRQVELTLGVGDGACGGERVGAAQAEPPTGGLLVSE